MKLAFKLVGSAHFMANKTGFGIKVIPIMVKEGFSFFDATKDSITVHRRYAMHCFILIVILLTNYWNYSVIIAEFYGISSVVFYFVSYSKAFNSKPHKWINQIFNWIQRFLTAMHFWSIWYCSLLDHHHFNRNGTYLKNGCNFVYVSLSALFFMRLWQITPYWNK